MNRNVYMVVLGSKSSGIIHDYKHACDVQRANQGSTLYSMPASFHAEVGVWDMPTFVAQATIESVPALECEP